MLVEKMASSLSSMSFQTKGCLTFGKPADFNGLEPEKPLELYAGSSYEITRFHP
jgi:hypothetical protein